MSSVTTLIEPRVHDIGGGLLVRRALPHMRMRSIGPFVFFDEFGPVDVPPGANTDVRPHPHIGLATLTYLFAGTQIHRDSLGTVQEIRPGDVNWMSAGRGIVHSERSPESAHSSGQHLHGIQTWVALPQADEDSEPAFQHYPGRDLPTLTLPGSQLRVVAGTAFGATSPLRVPSPTVYVAIEMSADSQLTIDADYAERGLYLLDGKLEVDGFRLGPGQLAILASTTLRVQATSACRLVLIGGAALDGPRFLWWNFVASSRQRIERAKADWREQRFAPIPGESDFIPLPEH